MACCGSPCDRRTRESFSSTMAATVRPPWSNAAAASWLLADTSLGKIIGPGFDEDGIVEAIDKATQVYLAQKQGAERFLDTYRRVGAEPFKEAIYG